VQALRAWLEAARIQSGPGVPSGPSEAASESEQSLSSEAVVQVVKRAVTSLGFDPAAYAGHSLRSGFVTEAEAARRGASEEAIVRQTGHRSIAVLRGYIQRATVFEPVLDPVEREWVLKACSALVLRHAEHAAGQIPSTMLTLGDLPALPTP
jgi:hypothetical protein